MTISRSELVDRTTPGIYHCVSRCVRRAFLCGWDSYSSKDYEHRRQWVRDRLEELARSFAVEVLAYAVMNTHSHEVVRNRPDVAAAWEDQEVARRWLRIFPRRSPIDGTPMAEPEETDIQAIVRNGRRVEQLRGRLSDISWFMRALNEWIARRANREDGCKGRFWEGRFKCQRLLDEAGLLTCMCYVDLNPVRAQMATSLEDSLFTSAYDRIMARRAREAAAGVQSGAAGSGEATEVSFPSPALEVEPGSEMVGGKVRATASQLARTAAEVHGADWLVSLDGPDAPFGALLGETEYLWLVDWTGRQLREDKPGVIDPRVAPILQSLGLDTEQWAKTVRGYRKLFWQAAGNGDSLKSFASRLGRRWLKGQLASRSAFLDAPQLA
jgi:hypothetical protein